ncbi:MAG: beta-propeller fold lactonase family protein [Acidobacteria bacterium]|nr:beta-propeller fold lactonase family protein [Acidobacteriota bacterium]
MRCHITATAITFCTCILLWSMPASAQGDLWLYVGSSRGDEVSIVDMNSLKLVGDVKAGERVHGVCLEPSGQRLFLTVESDHTLRIVDTVSQKTVGVVKLSGKPNECAVTPNGKYVTVPIRDGGVVEIVDVPEQKVVKSLPIKEPHNALNTGSNRFVYVSSMGSDEIDLIDLEKMAYAAHIPVGGRPRPYVISPDGKTMYVAVANLHGFMIVNIPERKVVRRVEMPSQHAALRPLKYETQDTLTHGLALSPDGRELWVSSLLDDSVYVYEVETGKIVANVPTGEGPNWIVITPDGKYVCVSNTDTDDVSIIDARTRREVTRVKVAKVPKRLALAPAPVRDQNTAKR